MLQTAVVVGVSVVVFVAAVVAVVEGATVAVVETEDALSMHGSE